MGTKMLHCSFCHSKDAARLKRRHVWTAAGTMANDELSSRTGQDFPEGLWRCLSCMNPYNA